MGATPRTATLVAFRDDELAAWLPVSLAEYVEGRMGAGETREVATRIATEQRAQVFPGGVPAPGHHLFSVVVDGERVGMVWLGPTADHDDVGRYLFNVEIDADKRGRGYGRAAMRAAEAWAVTQGATRLSLNVWGGNDVARSLYDSLGYVVAATHMYRDL
ncbi:MAG TPA: GNAT family N-acetyltransferase [Acidimicrobiales bacterium]|jgi:ribosomal protein S18 acetylase RimI-like enzyme|nr:GNAT family N-acetyltransferase [Acidimicrobiales bacterium]